MVYFTKYAEEKFIILARHRVHVSKEAIRHIVERPERRDRSRAPLMAADGPSKRGRAMRVLYREDKGARRVITFYPVVK